MISPLSIAARRSSRENQRASEISSPSTRITAPSPPADAWNPSISADGKGHGWLPTYSTASTRTPTSSETSRTTASSTDSPGSTKPARVEKRPSGQCICRPSSARSSSSVTSMMTAGSVRG